MDRPPCRNRNAFAFLEDWTRVGVRLVFPVLRPDVLCRFAVAVEIVAEHLFEEYRKAADSPVIDALDFAAYEVFGLVAQRDH